MGTTIDNGLFLFESTDKGIATQLNQNTLLLGSVVSRNVIDRDLSAPPGGESDLDTYIVGSVTPLSITDESAANSTFTVAGDESANFTSGVLFRVKGSTSNDGQYTTVSSAYGAATVITVVESVSGSAPDNGTINYATGDWNGHVDDVTIIYDSQWYFFTPSDGIIMYDSTDSEEVQFDTTEYEWAIYVIPTGGVPSGINANKIADGTVSNTEFQYINSVTSNVQDQIDVIGAPDSDSKTVFTISSEGQTTYAVGESYRSGSTKVFQDRLPLLRKIGADTEGFYDYEESGENIVLQMGLPLTTKLAIYYVAS